MRSTLLVPVPEAEPATARWWPDWQPPKARGVPAHVTLLIPFVPIELLAVEVLSELRDLFAGFAPFMFTLAVFGRFPNVLYLSPTPSEPFAALSSAVEQMFPDYPPYGDAHSDVAGGYIPHLTVAKSPDPALLDRIVSDLGQQLPIRCHASHVWLMHEQPSGDWSRYAQFPLLAQHLETA
jgi:2'-5' RNA ligase